MTFFRGNARVAACVHSARKACMHTQRLAGATETRKWWGKPHPTRLRVFLRTTTRSDLVFLRRFRPDANPCRKNTWFSHKATKPRSQETVSAALFLVILVALCEQFFGRARRPRWALRGFRSFDPRIRMGNGVAHPACLTPKMGANARPFRDKNASRVKFLLFLCGAGLRAFGRGPEGSERDILLLGVERNICQVFGFCTTYASRQTSIRGVWAPAMADWRWRIAD
jgi:hypothetical protein